MIPSPGWSRRMRDGPLGLREATIVGQWAAFGLHPGGRARMRIRCSGVCKGASGVAFVTVRRGFIRSPRRGAQVGE